VRHIPEDELHAYLDQALSRSQCIEIETHLSRCAGCRTARDGVAALRDRTTALLARSMPRLVTPPAYASLAQRAVTHRRHSWRRSALWAASLAGALIGGWGLRAALDPHPAESPMAMTTAPPSAIDDLPASDLPINPSAEVATALPAPAETRQAAPPLATVPARLTAEGVAASAAPAREIEAPSESPATALDALWSPVTLEEAEDATGALVPTIPGLPVVEIQLRRGGPQERPLLMVSQHHPSGEMIHTIEGPVAMVAAVVADQLEQRFHSSEPARSLPDYLDTASGIRRTSRVLVVVSRLPADSLNALVQTVVLK
jgi:anti-sigma factor RsiW